MELRDAWTVGILAAVFGVLTDRLLTGSGKKRKRIAVGCALFVAVYTVMGLVLRGSVMTAIKGGIFAMLLLCAAKEDCDTRIVGNYLSVEILLIGLIGIDADSIPDRLLLAAVSLIPVLLVERLSPKNPIGGAGVEWESGALAEKLLRQTDIYRETGGGVTLSGGEPLLQWQFAAELLDRLHGKVHTAIETSGYAEAEVFRAVIDRCDFVYMDLKLMDCEKHKAYTGVYNDRILQNAAYLKASGKPHTFRTPLIPSITDTEENLAAIRAFIGDDSWEQLPYNTLAPAKYASVGRGYRYSLPEKHS